MRRNRPGGAALFHYYKTCAGRGAEDQNLFTAETPRAQRKSKSLNAEFAEKSRDSCVLCALGVSAVKDFDLECYTANISLRGPSDAKALAAGGCDFSFGHDHVFHFCRGAASGPGADGLRWAQEGRRGFQEHPGAEGCSRRSGRPSHAVHFRLSRWALRPLP